MQAAIAQADAAWAWPGRAREGRKGMKTFNKDTWTPQARARWQRWWQERLALCGLGPSDFANNTDADEPGAGGWRNTLDSFRSGDPIALQRIFSPSKKTKVPGADRLAKIAKAVSLADDPVDTDRLWRLLEEVQPDKPVREPVTDAWHADFAHVPADKVSVPAVWPEGPSRREGEPLADLVKRIREAPTSRRSSRGQPWVWISGPRGSGRHHASAQLRVAVEKDSPEAELASFDAPPAGGWERFREGNPGVIAIAVVEHRPRLARGGHDGDIEIALGTWGGGQLFACAEQLRASGIIDETELARLGTFAKQALEQPELLGPDKRPVAVIGLAAQVVAGAAPTTPQDVRGTIRDAAWRSTLARLPDNSALQRDGQRLVSVFWALRLQQAADGHWWRVPRMDAEACLSKAAHATWKPSAARTVDVLLAEADVAKAKDRRSAILTRIAELTRCDGAVLLRELESAGLFVATGEHIEPSDRVRALLDATCDLPTAVSPTVLADLGNIDVPREWALHGHAADRVATVLADSELRVRPFACRWLLEFAWQQREKLDERWVRRHVAQAWAELTLAELHGYGHVAGFDPWEGHEDGRQVTQLLRDVSLYWSGWLPDLDPARPYETLHGLVAAEIRQLLQRWLELRVRLAQEHDSSWSLPRWLPWVIASTLFNYGDDRHRCPEVSAFAEYATTTLWWLAPGQLLALQPGEVPDEYLVPWQRGHAERLQCQTARAERGERVAQAWLAGECLDMGDNCFPLDHNTGQSWGKAPVAVRLRWLRERAKGEPREVLLLNYCLRFGTDDKKVAPADHWDSICAILERQPREWRAELVSHMALPWLPDWHELECFSESDGLRLAERFGFTEILESALETPQRWLEHQRAVRYRGDVRLNSLRDVERDVARLTRAFCSKDDTWGGLASAEQFAQDAACALYRLGRRHHLLQRWTEVAQWHFPEALLADLSALEHQVSSYDFRRDGGEPAAVSSEVAAEGLAWLSAAAGDLDVFGFDVGLPPELRRQRVEDELKRLHALAVDPRRMDVAAHELRRHVGRGDDLQGQSKWFWASATTPVERDRPSEERLAEILLHALWLWTKPPLPPGMTSWLADLEARRPRAEWSRPPEAHVASWQTHYGLRDVAIMRAARAAQALLDFADDTPLHDWIASLALRGGANWFEGGKLAAVGKVVKADEFLGAGAFRCAVAHPGSVVRQGEADADRVLHELEPSYPTASRPAASWVAVELMHAPSTVCKRFLDSSRHERDGRFLPIFRRLHGEATTFSERMWFARRIHELDRRDPALLVGIQEWLGTMPEPIAGTPELRHAMWQDEPVCGFADFLTLASQLWRAGDLAREVMRAGLHRLAGLIPPLRPVTEDAVESESEPDDARASAREYQTRRIRETNESLGELPDKLLDLAVELDDLGLAEHVCRCTGRASDARLEQLAPDSAQEQKRLALVEILDDEGDLFGRDMYAREQAAEWLAVRGLHTSAVRTFAEHLLGRLVAAAAPARTIAYMLEIFDRLGDEDWNRALALLTPDLRTLVQAEALAMGWCGGRTTSALDGVLKILADEAAPGRISEAL